MFALLLTIACVWGGGDAQNATLSQLMLAAKNMAKNLSKKKLLENDIIFC